MPSNSTRWKTRFRQRAEGPDLFNWRTRDGRNFPGHAENGAANLSLLLFIAELLPNEDLAIAARFAQDNSVRPHLSEPMVEAVARVSERLRSTSRNSFAYEVETLPGQRAMLLGSAAAQVSAVLFIARLTPEQQVGLLKAFPQRKWSTLFVSQTAVELGEAAWMLKATLPHWLQALTPSS